MSRAWRSIVVAGIVTIAGISGSATAARLTASCVRTGAEIVCDLRSDENVAIQSVGAVSAGQPVAVQFEAFDPLRRPTAWYFVIQQNAHPQDSVQAIERMVRHEGLRSYAVGSFTERLEERAAPGAGDADIRKLREILTIARDVRTNLYMAANDAVGRLLGVPAERRGLVLFVDGSSATEDYRDVLVRAISGSNVLLVGVVIGRGGRAAAVRSLVDEVRGIYHEAAACARPQRPPIRCLDFDVSDAFAQSLLGLLENGGTARLPASAVPAGSALSLRVAYADGTTATADAITIRPGPAPAAAARAPAEGPGAPAPGDLWARFSLQAVRSQLNQLVPERLRGYMPEWAQDTLVLSAAGGMLALGLLLLLGAIRRSRRAAAAAVEQDLDLAAVPDHMEHPVEPEMEEHADPAYANPPTRRPPASIDAPMPDTNIITAGSEQLPGREALAWLRFLDANATRVPIVATNVRIGRHPDNDITLENRTVHRHHAVLNRAPNGKFTITDLDTLNRVLVNRLPCKQKELVDGDLVELGEVRFRFYSGANGGLEA